MTDGAGVIIIVLRSNIPELETRLEIVTRARPSPFDFSEQLAQEHPIVSLSIDMIPATCTDY